MKYQVRRKETHQHGGNDAPAFLHHKELTSSDCVFDTKEKAQALADDLQRKAVRLIDGHTAKYYVRPLII